MNKSDFSTIYNIPEEISGLGCIAHFIGLCLFPALGLFVIPDMFADNSWLKELIQDIISAGMLVTLGFAFIFIVCPIYFFVRCIMEFYRYKKCKQKFYSTPNIEYIKLNSDDIFFKNTCPNLDFTINKSDIVNVIIDGKVKSVSYLKATRTPGVAAYIENLALTIKTNSESYTIYPQVKSKHLSKKQLVIDEIELLKEQIAFYKSYFDNIDVLFDYGGTDTYSETISAVKAYELENSISEKSNNPFDIIYKIILVGIFIYFIYEMFFVLK